MSLNGMSASLTTVSAPVVRSTVTSVTPDRPDTSSVTACTQWAQVIPLTT